MIGEAPSGPVPIRNWDVEIAELEAMIRHMKAGRMVGFAYAYYLQDQTYGHTLTSYNPLAIAGIVSALHHEAARSINEILDEGLSDE